MLEICAGIKLCVLVSFEVQQILCDFYLCVFKVSFEFLNSSSIAVFCSVAPNNCSLLIAERGVNFPLTCAASCGL